MRDVSLSAAGRARSGRSRRHIISKNPKRTSTILPVQRGKIGKFSTSSNMIKVSQSSCESGRFPWVGRYARQCRLMIAFISESDRWYNGHQRNFRSTIAPKIRILKLPLPLPIPSHSIQCRHKNSHHMLCMDRPFDRKTYATNPARLP